MSLRIFSTVSPSTLIVRTKELLLDRFDDHLGLHVSDAGMKKDCTHWCTAGSTWHEFVSTVLTAVLADGRRLNLPWAIAE